MLNLAVIGSWLLDFQPQGVGGGKQRERNCLWEGEVDAEKEKSRCDPFTGKEGSHGISLGGLK